MLVSFFPAPTNAVNTTTEFPMPAPKPVESTEASLLLARLDVIKEMDFKMMNSSEKKQLRQEVRTIKKNLKALTGGVYLSAGAIIIILLIIILLL
jgi:hypothetical protein